MDPADVKFLKILYRERRPAGKWERVEGDDDA